LPQQTPEPHPISNSVTLGFNQTVERLESEIRGKEITSMAAVFVARGDTTSTQLYAQFPLMAGMLPQLRLVSLAKGAEERLCQTLSLRRVGVIGILVYQVFVMINCRLVLLERKRYCSWLMRRCPRLSYHG